MPTRKNQAKAQGSDAGQSYNERSIFQLHVVSGRDQSNEVDTKAAALVSLTEP
jgi:hypothetical protein